MVRPWRTGTAPGKGGPFCADPGPWTSSVLPAVILTAFALVLSVACECCGLLGGCRAPARSCLRFEGSLTQLPYDPRTTLRSGSKRRAWGGGGPTELFRLVVSAGRAAAALPAGSARGSEHAQGLRPLSWTAGSCCSIRESLRVAIRPRGQDRLENVMAVACLAGLGQPCPQPPAATGTGRATESGCRVRRRTKARCRPWSGLGLRLRPPDSQRSGQLSSLGYRDSVPLAKAAAQLADVWPVGSAASTRSREWPSLSGCPQSDRSFP